MELKVRGTVPLGSRLWLDDQPYTLVAYHPFERVDGSMTNLHVWRGQCAGCGGDFDTQMAGLSRKPNRRCDACKVPAGGPPVGKPGQRVTVALELPIIVPAGGAGDQGES